MHPLRPRGRGRGEGGLKGKAGEPRSRAPGRIQLSLHRGPRLTIDESLRSWIRETIVFVFLLRNDCMYSIKYYPTFPCLGNMKTVDAFTSMHDDEQ